MAFNRGAAISVAYRLATVGDAHTVAQVFRTSFCDTFAHLYSAEDLATFLSRCGSDSWAAEIADGRHPILLADDGGKCVGFVKLGPLELPVETSKAAIELGSLYLLHGWHGRGIPAHLMDWAIAEARRRGAEEMYLSVFTDNHRAKRFYARYGFEEIGPYKFMVGNQADDDILMRLTL